MLAERQQSGRGRASESETKQEGTRPNIIMQMEVRGKLREKVKKKKIQLRDFGERALGTSDRAKPRECAPITFLSSPSARLDVLFRFMALAYLAGMWPFLHE